MATVAEDATILTLDEIAALASNRGEPEKALADIVALIAERFKTDVCSLYLLEPDRVHLVLAATVGLKPDSVGNVRMKISEGLAGLVAEKVQPVAVAEASLHPRYKFFRGSGEENYKSFLGAPLVDRGVLQGVLVVQTVAHRDFSPVEVDTMVGVAARLDRIVGEARTLEQFVAPAQDRLWAIALNLWWCWNNDGAELFRSLDPVRWRELVHNPIALLNKISLAELEERAGQFVLHSRINNVYHRLQDYLNDSHTWAATHAGVLNAAPVAYFSAEFGIHESLPVYSGGLGVLAGDHIKSASDLGVPLVGIGLFYAQGYFHQQLDTNGWQVERYQDTDASLLPVSPAIDKDGQPITVSIDTRTGPIYAKVWRLAVGRCTLLLLDANVEENKPEDRELTARLYGGDSRTRIRQELLLGVGGLRALAALGIRPGVLHLNEGHSAFAALEMVRMQMKDEGASLDDACRMVTQQTVFTTHTPVPAGHDRFSAELIEEHLGPIREAIGLPLDRFLGFGRVDGNNQGETFCMTVLALKLSRRANAVSSLHGNVSRRMWHSLFPGRGEEQVPIGHITNGVHVPTWLAPQMHQLYDRTLGSDWPAKSAGPEIWMKVDKIKDAELWETHLTLKSRMIDFVRRRAVRDAERRGEPVDHVNSLKRVLSPDSLTIGFARRFATYKRAHLFLTDLEKLIALVTDAKHPVQFVFAGKAHPHDQPGKTVMREIVQLMRHAKLSGKIVFVEDYDINVARHLVQGVDVWLNNPRRPLEASGTSGQKVVLNGGLNFSVLDGWWDEAFDGRNGFSIGDGNTHVDDSVQDVRDANSLYQRLAKEVIPLYYARDEQGLPRGWIERMKNGIRTLGWRFHANRMVMDYVRECYVPAAGGRSSEM